MYFDEEGVSLSAWKEMSCNADYISLFRRGVVQRDTTYKADVAAVCQNQLNILLFPALVHEVILDNMTPFISLPLVSSSNVIISLRN